MFKNYLKIVLRSIKRHKGYSLINISGLGIGMACCLLITIWVLDELSYDKFHENAAMLYRVEENQHYTGKEYHVNVTPHPLAPVLKDEIRISLMPQGTFGPGESCSVMKKKPFLKTI